MTLLGAATLLSPTGAPPSGTLEAHLATLDTNPSTAGFQFELSAAYWLEADPVWGPLIKRVWLWDAWTDRASAAGVADPDDDLGIDLAVELHSGEWMAVQVKHRHHVPTRDIDSFLGAVAANIGWPPGRGGGWDHAMLIMTCPWDRVWENGRRKLTGAGVHIVDRAVLAGSAVLWPTFDELTAGAAPTRRPPRSPRPHQAAAVAGVADALAATGADRATLVMACGTGKTLTAQRAAEELLPAGGLIVVAAPTLSLLDQVACAWLRDAVPAGSLTDWVVVGSDPTVATGGRALANADVRHLPSVTTDPAVLAGWLRRRRSAGVRRVVFTTHASLPVVAQALDTARRWADLLIVDEAHRVTGRGVDAELATGDGFRARRRLFCTATPRVFTAAAKESAAAGGLEVLSMDDEARFGTEAHHLSFAEAADAGLVCDLDVLASVVTDADVAHAVGDRALLDLAGGVVDADLVAAAVAVARAAGDRDLRRLLTFHSTVKRAREFAAVLNTVWPMVATAGGTLVAEAVSGDTSALDRRAALRRLADLEATADLEAGPQPVDRMVLCSARLLGEGIDVPAVDAVVFCDPRHSPVDIAQAVGRACRTAPGKTAGTVVVPVHLSADAAVDANAAVDHDVWGGVFAALAAVISHDERFRAVVTDACFELGRRPGTLHGGGNGSVSVIEFLAAGDVDPAFLAAVTTAAINLTTPAWWTAAGELGAWYDTQSGPPARLADDPAERRLAKWAARQREAYVAGCLDPAQVAALETLGGWVWNPNDDNWQAMLANLHAFAAANPDAFDHGTLVVPIKGVWVQNAEGTPQNLGQWASRQRTDIARAAAGNPPNRQVDYRLRAQLLAEVPGWSLDPTRAISAARWEATAAEVAAAAADLGRLPTKAHDKRHAEWIHRAWRHARAGTLTEHQIAVCEQIPHWRWQGP